MLRDLKTNLKSLKFGNDRLGGGSSNQPYIQTKIPDGDSSFSSYNTDFLLRGGINSGLNSIEDASRLTKYFSDTSTLSGVFFTTKQNLLSRVSVKTQSSNIINGGVYNPLNTITQVGVNAFGIHTEKQSILPFVNTKTYNSVVNQFQQLDQNRLVRLYQNVKTNSSSKLDGFILNNGNVLTYEGGPGSVLGVGQTNIRFSDQRTGNNNINSSQTFFTGKNPPPDNSSEYKKPFGASKEYNRLIISPENQIKLDILNQFNNFNSNVFNVSVYNSGSTFPDDNTNLTTFNGTKVLSQTQLNELSQINKTRNSPSFVPKTFDFRNILRRGLTQSTILSNSPSYDVAENKTVEGRINAGDPGNKTNKNLISYTKGSGIGPVDKINALPVYRSNVVDQTSKVNDLVKFRIAIIDNNEPSFKTFLHFRAFLNPISDNYNSEWETIKYLGRGENFYSYNGFNRNLSLSWTVVAQSKEELIPMYKKLNFLASSLAPDYSPNGYMKGNLIQLTIGGYIYEQPGIINSLSFELDDQTTWEIGINDEGNNDPTVKELPHIIRVNNFNFTPIQSFIPSVQPSGNENGPNRFISLSNGFGSNKNNYDS